MTQFKLIAGTNIGLRKNNEDNFTVCADLAAKDWGIPVNYQEEIQLGELGCILVVADGMGGQNAGEVASSIAVETVQNMFSRDALPKNVVDSDDSIKNYLKKVICAADTNIKKRTCEDDSTSGMGSTIVIVWAVGKFAYVAWLGDSRAYCIVKDKGIVRLTKDHSYVQGLVDAGRITEEQAMTHPDSNIILRSLGDTSQKAKPDVVSVDLVEGEVILLCTDGLCGVCQDPVIGGIVEEHVDDLRQCREELISAALASGGSDNITVAMLQICSCEAGAVDPKVITKAPKRKIKLNAIIYSVLLLVIAVLACMLIFKDEPHDKQSNAADNEVVQPKEQSKPEVEKPRKQPEKQPSPQSTDVLESKKQPTSEEVSTDPTADKKGDENTNEEKNPNVKVQAGVQVTPTSEKSSAPTPNKITPINKEETVERIDSLETAETIVEEVVDEVVDEVVEEVEEDPQDFTQDTVIPIEEL